MKTHSPRPWSAIEYKFGIKCNYRNPDGSISPNKWEPCGNFVIDRDGCVVIDSNDALIVEWEDLVFLCEAVNATGSD